MKRGEIWTVSGAPGYGSKPRPVLIVQSDLIMDLHSVLTCGLTSVLNDDMAFRPFIEPSASNGLGAPSNVMVEKVTAVSREKVGSLIGSLSAADMSKVERALLLVLGLAQ